MLTTVQTRIFWAAVIVLAIIFFIAGWVIRDIGVNWIFPLLVVAGAIVYRSRSSH